MAGIIHDVGKIAIPSEILTKPTRLREMEFAMIKTHTDAGYNILKDIDFPWPIAEIILQHHEKLNGSGYPRGLSGEDILVEARIMCVADVVEAIAADRPYRAALGIEAAVDEISKEKGILFDPEAVDACLRIIRNGGFHIE
jgi:HD-GYP domain-containing protein (c-di-GMP phosphodiesterase class II)